MFDEKNEPVAGVGLLGENPGKFNFGGYVNLIYYVCFGVILPNNPPYFLSLFNRFESELLENNEELAEPNNSPVGPDCCPIFGVINALPNNPPVVVVPNSELD